MTALFPFRLRCLRPENLGLCFDCCEQRIAVNLHSQTCRRLLSSTLNLARPHVRATGQHPIEQAIRQHAKAIHIPRRPVTGEHAVRILRLLGTEMHKVICEIEMVNAPNPALRDVGETDRGLGIVFEQHIGRTQVAMRDAVLVQPCQCIGDFINMPPSLFWRQTIAGRLERGRLPKATAMAVLRHHADQRHHAVVGRLVKAVALHRQHTAMMRHLLQGTERCVQCLAVDRHRTKHLHRAGLAMRGNGPVYGTTTPAADQVLQFMSGDFRQTHARFGYL